MGSGPETRYRLRVEACLPPEIYHLKLNLPYAAGPADAWYSMRLGQDMWVEYKWINKLPVRKALDLVSGKNPILSKLQQDWLGNRHMEGRNVAVIVGTAKGGLILPGLMWMDPIPTGGSLLDKRAVAEWITSELQPC